MISCLVWFSSHVQQGRYHLDFGQPKVDIYQPPRIVFSGKLVLFPPYPLTCLLISYESSPFFFQIQHISWVKGDFEQNLRFSQHAVFCRELCFKIFPSAGEDRKVSTFFPLTRTAGRCHLVLFLLTCPWSCLLAVLGPVSFLASSVLADLPGDSFWGRGGKPPPI